MLNLLSYGLRPEVTCLSRMPFPRFTVTVPLARHLVSSVSPRSLRSLATRVKRSRLRLGRGCGECEECRKKRPTLSRHHHSSSRGLVLPLLSSPYNHFQAFQSSTVVTGWEASEETERVTAPRETRMLSFPPSSTPLLGPSVPLSRLPASGARRSVPPHDRSAGND